MLREIGDFQFTDLPTLILNENEDGKYAVDYRPSIVLTFKESINGKRVVISTGNTHKEVQFDCLKDFTNYFEKWLQTEHQRCQFKDKIQFPLSELEQNLKGEFKVWTSAESTSPTLFETLNEAIEYIETWLGQNVTYEYIELADESTGYAFTTDEIIPIREGKVSCPDDLEGRIIYHRFYNIFIKE